MMFEGDDLLNFSQIRKRSGQNVAKILFLQLSEVSQAYI